MYVTLVKSKHLNHENEAQYSQSDIFSGRVYYNTKARLFLFIGLRIRRP